MLSRPSEHTPMAAELPHQRTHLHQRLGRRRVLRCAPNAESSDAYRLATRENVTTDNNSGPASHSGQPRSSKHRGEAIS